MYFVLCVEIFNNNFSLYFFRLCWFENDKNVLCSFYIVPAIFFWLDTLVKMDKF